MGGLILGDIFNIIRKNIIGQSIQEILASSLEGNTGCGA